MSYSHEQMVMPFLDTLNDLGGTAKPKDIYDKLAKKINISEKERMETIESKGHKYNKWNRFVRWVKETLKLKNFVSSPSRGLWEITEKGKDFLKNAKPGVIVTVYEIVDDEGQSQAVALWGEAQACKNIIKDGMVKLVITSPPYPLANSKEYGNVNEKKYVEWFMPIAEQIYKALSNDGSLVLNLGPTYIKGSPVRSLYTYRLVLALCDELGFNLAQEFYWFNPGKLPTSNWVTIDRVRIKDSVEKLLWLSKSPNPYADNRNVLEPYSESYIKLLKNGGYKVMERPSGHKITHFNKDNGGKIPSNLLVYSNSNSKDSYFKYCKKFGIKIHPARFPIEIPEFFIKFLTNPGEVVWDMFGGSGSVLEAAYKLGRKGIITEKSLTYLWGSLGRFIPQYIKNIKLFEPLKSLIKAKNLCI